TKRDLYEFYGAVAPWILPYLESRPLVLTRYPDGIAGKSFYQKNVPVSTPEWIRTESVRSESSEKAIEYFVADDRATLLYLANLGSIPLHVWASRIGSIDRPDWCVIDLDPKGAPFEHVVAVARVLHDVCEDIGLESFVKTSGSTGLHVMLPLGRSCTYGQSRSLGELLAGRTSRNLVRVFLLGEELKRRGKKHPHGIERVHVVGAGVMGADIAIWTASRGFAVTLQDRHPEILARAMQKAHAFYRKKLKQPRAVQEAMDRLMPDLRGDGLARADLVIEAIVENVDAKRGLFTDVEARVRPTTLLASNTSSIPLEEIATALKDPARLVGLHFFNPVAQMQLVEIVRGAQSGEDALNRARGFATALDRLPLDVKSSPGFLVNRVLMPYLIEAMKLVEEGVPLAEIDGAALDFGMPMGPIRLADTVGLDICLSVAEELSGPLNIQVPQRLRNMVAAGQLGIKSGSGFYQYDARGKPTKGGSREPRNEPITERLILRMVNESVACLREGVVADLDSIDAGMVYGTGFAPYLGGPMRYADTLGDVGIRASLDRLAEEYGQRFQPDAGWLQRELFQR
ncbi:MAG TPA: hypothetical protein DIC36_00190, partial [Gammaproteobacteria bacterium]|nr:hypothetical protein [Gammaproteobacteria bacterium]